MRTPTGQAECLMTLRCKMYHYFKIDSLGLASTTSRSLFISVAFESSPIAPVVLFEEVSWTYNKRSLSEIALRLVLRARDCTVHATYGLFMPAAPASSLAL